MSIYCAPHSLAFRLQGVSKSAHADVSRSWHGDSIQDPSPNRRGQHGFPSVLTVAANLFAIVFAPMMVHADDLSTVLQHWTHRQQQVKSLRCRIVGNDFTRDLETNVVTDKVGPYVHEIAFEGGDGRRMLYRSTRPMLIEETSKREEHTHTYTVNDAERRVLMQMTNIPVPVGNISASEVAHHFHDMDLKAIMLCLRPLSREMGGIGDSVLMLPDSSSIGGRLCRSLSLNNGIPPLYVYSVDVAAQGIVRRYSVRFSDGSLHHQLDINYAPDPIITWFPSSWSLITTLKDRKATRTYSQQVETYEINAQFDKSVFETAFPIGTLVHDDRAGMRRSYIVEAGGNNKSIDAAEAKRIWTDNAAKVHPSLAADPPRPLGAAFKLGVMLVVMVVVVVSTVLRRKQKG